MFEETSIPVFADIRNNATGEVRTYEMDLYLCEEGKPRTFIWEEGNYACDCNRELFFERAAGNEPDNTACGDEKFSVRLRDKETGTIYYDELAERAPLTSPSPK